MGRGVKLPPQFGHTPARTSIAQSRQNVHSKVQIIAEVESAGRSRSQHSQLGRSSSIGARWGLSRNAGRPTSGRTGTMHPDLKVRAIGQ